MNLHQASKQFTMAGLCRLVMTLLLLGLCQTADASSPDNRHGIGEDYNPTSPGNPGTGESGDTETRYRLTVVTNPVGAGSAYVSSSSLKAGEKTHVYCYNGSGFTFRNWTIEGEEVSTDTGFDYVMPEHDVTIVANYVYDPASPGNPSPEEQKVKHPVTIRVLPSGAGSVSPSGTFSMEENSSRDIYAYPNTGWKLTGWTINGQQQASADSPLRITMGEKALDIAAYFIYEPASPSNPGANFYNPTTGEAIIDDFAAGNLYSALTNTIGYDNYSNVSSLIVKGQMTSNDVGTIGYLSNVGTIDLSRTGGVTKVPSYAFESMDVSSVLLPATITSIGYLAFYDCANLASLTIYAPVPPACDANAFSSKENCTVYVPREAIELYQNADQWKDFTILPIMTDAHMLQVTLPEGAADGRYKHNSIEIVNLRSGVRQKYVVSDRLVYTFNGLQKGEKYAVYMMSQSGYEIGRIEEVVIPDDDIEVSFDELRTLHAATAKVLAPDGSDVTDQVGIEWLKPLDDGTLSYLRKAVSVGEIPEGERLLCRIALDGKLGSAYVNPEDAELTVGDADNTVTVRLAPFRSIALSGTVVDADGSALSGASVSASQTLNGKYSKTYTAKTDRKGEWSLDVLDAPETTLTFAASECVNVVDTIGAFGKETVSVDCGKTAMKSIVGARINYGFTYHEAGVEEAETYYSDYQNVAISVYNETQQRAHNDVSVQYPLLAVLDENINAGDVLTLTATSKTGAFNPIEKKVTIGENQRADVTFDIVGKGGIQASFEMTENPAVTAMLYSEKGELLRKQAYSDAKTIFTGLEDGNYTLVSMGQSDLMNSILRLSNFAEIGLAESKDYMVNSVKVESGKLTEVSNPEIPAFDESVFYYTNSSTSFSSNKSSITTGNYLTLRAAIDFKGVYKDAISNVALVVDLPEACDFVEQSVIQGPNLLPYTFENNRLTVQLGDNYLSQTRFCVVPTTGGSFNASASIVFDYDGKKITQPIGTAISEIKDLELIAPFITSTLDFYVSGSAPANSEVEIYEGSTMIGKGRVNLNGDYKIKCELYDPYTNYPYYLYANITTSTRNVLTTETVSLRYDRKAAAIKSVTMTEGSNKVVFDFLNPDSTNKYYYFTFGSFTFLIDFEHPQDVDNVVLYVHTTSGDVVAFPASYDQVKDRWFVTSKFNTNSLPINVSVDYDLIRETTADSRHVAQMSQNIKDVIGVLEHGELQNLFARAKEAAAGDDLVSFDRILDEIQDIIGVTLDPTDDSEKLDMEEVNKYLTENASEPLPDNLLNKFSFVSEDGKEYAFEVGTLAELNITNEALSVCDSLKLDNDKYLLYSVSEDRIFIVDPDNDHVVNFDFNVSSVPSIPSASRVVDLSWMDGFLTEWNRIEGVLGSLDSDFGEFIEGVIELFNKNIGDAARNLRIVNHHKELQMEGIYTGESLKSILDKKDQLEESLAKFTKAMSWVKALVKIIDIASLIKDISDAKDSLEEWEDIIRTIEGIDCPGMDALARKANGYAKAVAAGYGTNITINSASVIGIVNLIKTHVGKVLGTTWGAIVAVAINDFSIIQGGCNQINDINWKSLIRNQIPTLKCKPEDPNKDPRKKKKTGRNGKGGDHKSRNSDSKYGIDPSGYVYEAVPANRVEGVQATIYYKETKEDMYGDPYEEIILWNAEEYAQKNPLFTDENGMYQWDVPQGLWQVKFEKDGYATAYSEWLPVPPPQLEVNIGIVQNKQPEVTEARAYEDGIEVQFDKFMDTSTLNTSNIYVTANGQKLEGEVTMVDSELADEYASKEDKDALRYASRVRFVPEEKLSTTTGEIRLTVSRNVLSYAGIPMTETFTQVLDVEKEVKAIVADDVKVLYGGEKELTISAIPYDAAVGRKLSIEVSSDLIASIDKTEAILDEEGKATVTVKGDLPGVCQLTFSIEDVTETGDCSIDVVTELITAEAPKASRASGTAVYRGTKVEFTTESKDATIYFTTDGSCPCDENGTRRKYTVPIVINDDTKILAMTSVGNGDSEVSETVEFNYTLKRSDIDFQLNEGWTWISHNLESPIAPSDLSDDEGIQRVVSSTQETVRQPELGLTGTLTALSAAESYKVQTSAATARKRLSDVAWNPATPISVTQGWNWIGYPAAQTMTVGEAFATTKAEALDVVIGQAGFCQYDGENWIGTLETMSPGEGYMYLSQGSKDIVYNTSIVSKASSSSFAGISVSSPLVVDIHRYSSAMPMVATLSDADGIALDSEEYAVAAFSGSECRGIGRVVNGLLMMNVYGEKGDSITILVTDPEGMTTYPNEAALEFGEKTVGDIFTPYVIPIGDTSGVAEVEYAGNVKVYFEGDMLRIKGVPTEEISFVEIYDLQGQKLAHEGRIGRGGIRLTTLTDGFYVVIVKDNGRYTYHKVAK